MPKTLTKEELYAVSPLDNDAQMRIAVGLAARDDLQTRDEIIALARRMYLKMPTNDRDMEWAVWQLMATGALKKEDTFYYKKYDQTDAYLIHAANQIEDVMKEKVLNIRTIGEQVPYLNSTALQKLITIAQNDRRRKIEESKVYSIFTDPM